MRKIVAASFLSIVAAGLTGCATNPNVLQMHKVTAETLGLASTDEMTMGPVKKGKPDFLGGTELTFEATTAKGRTFNCSTYMTPGILLEPPKYSRLTCTQ